MEFNRDVQRLLPAPPTCYKSLQNHAEVTKLRSFLEPPHVFRRFVPNFARIGAHINCNHEKGLPEKFDSLHEEKITAMETLQEKLIPPPVLALLCAGEHFTLDTDAYNVRVSCVLLHNKPVSTKRLINYWSCSMIKAKQIVNHI